MDYPFILYIFLSVVIVWGGTVGLIRADRSISAFLFVIGSILVLVYYGLRWFSKTALKGVPGASSSWPPVINMCPDFLTLHKRMVDGKTEQVCVDLVGVSRGGMMKFIDETNVNNDAYIFKLYQNLSGPQRISRLCQECREKKVTWEGVFDGVGCTAASVPNPNGTTDSITPSGKCD